MVDIKIFLASSIVEFEKERMELSNHILRLNNQYHKRGVYFTLVICENLSSELVREGKQEEYNREIEDSQYVYILVGNRLGSYTREEFDIALRHFQEKESPRIHTFFVHEAYGIEADESVRAFMDYIDKELNHYYNEVDNIDAVKLDLTLELIANPAVGGDVQIEDGKALLDGQEMFSVESLPLYRNNEALRNVRAELEDANNEFVRLRTAMLDDPGNDEVLSDLMDVQARRTKLSDQVSQMERSVLESCNLVREKGRIGSQLDWRERQALDLVNKGDLKAANAILRDALWDREFAQAIEIGESAVEKCREYLSGKRLLASNLKALGVTAKSEQEITDVYELICATAEKWQVELDALCEYAEFLQMQRHYTRSIEVAERCVKRYELAGDVKPEEFARLYKTAGTSYYHAHDYVNAIDRHGRAVGLYEQLAAEAPALYERMLVDAYNNLASDYASVKDQVKRESYLLKALEIGERLLQVDRMGTAEIVASTYNRLAIANNRMNRSEDAETYHLKALELRRMLATSDPKRYEPVLAETFNNLAYLCKKQNRHEEAEAYYKDCIEIRRRISAENPSAYETKLALTLANYSELLHDEGRFAEAEACARESVSIRERWTRMDEASFSPGLAISLKRLADILRDCGDPARVDEAEECYRRSLSIRRKLAEKEPVPNETSIASICSSLAVMLADHQRLEEAEALFAEAVVLQGKYSTREGTSDDRKMARILCEYSRVLHAMGRDTNALDNLEAACVLYEQLAEKNPRAYEGEYAHVCSERESLRSEIKS